MEDVKSFISEMVGKTILVKTQGGAGIRDASLKAGEYKGTLLGFDGSLIKLEYNITKFSGGKSVVSKDVVLINTSYIMTVEEYREREG